MNDNIISIYVTRYEGVKMVYVAVGTDDLFWKAFRSNKLASMGYPIHDTRVINEALIQDIAKTGVPCTQVEARKFFYELPRKYNEN